jgi:hypothetical protein
MKVDIPRYVDEKEVSRIIGRAVQTLRNERFRGQGIPYVKMGRAVRYRLSDVIEFMENRKVKTDPLER